MSNVQPNLINQIIAERWLIIEFLGEGLMSYVYKAQDTETGKIIVLKLIKKKLLAQSDHLKILDKQAKDFIALNHENIASYYNLNFSTDGELYLFCDYLQGRSLANSLSASGKLKIEQSIQLAQQIATGISYAHEKKIWHGDLRPSNIFIVNDQFSTDEVKIVDFGIISLVDNERSKTGLPLLSKTTNAPYTSLEQKAGQNIDKYSDLYSLGCLMYEMLTGKPPYVGTNAMATAYKQKQQTTTALHEILPTHPHLGRYQTVVNKLLKANRQERYQSAADLKTDLELLSTASDSDWLKKANAFKQSTYSQIFARRWHILTVILVLALTIFLITQTLSIVAPYSQPWTGQTEFDDNKLWVVQEKRIASPSDSVVKEKYLLEGKLTSLTKNKQEPSSEYAETLFAYCRALLACGQWQEAQTKLVELQKSDITKTKIKPADIFAHRALAYFMLSDLKSAKNYCQKVLNDPDKNSIPAMDNIIVLKIQGDLYTNRSEDDKALTVYKEMHKLAAQEKLRDPIDYAYACALLADSYRKDKNYVEAEKLYKEAVDWGINFIGQKQFFMAKAFYGLALTEYELGKLPQAQQGVEMSLPIAIAQQGNKSKFVITLKRFNDYLLFHTNLLGWAKQHWSGT